MPSPSFADLGVSAAVCAALSERGIDRPFPVQRRIVPDVLAGHDVLVQSPTGSGKTLAFGVPLVERIEATDGRPAALVLAPTRELAAQIEDELYSAAHARALKIAVAYGGVGIVKQARLAGRAHVLVATPGRLLDLIDRGDVSLDAVRLLVLDEADRMLDMGFRPVVERIVAMTRDDRQTILCSATLEGEVGRLATRYTRDARRHEVAATERERRGHIDHHFVRVEHTAKVDRLVTELRGDARGLTLVFVRTKRGADRLVKRLRAQGLEAVAMHGDKTQSQREKALARFESGVVDTLVATDVAARGIDVTGITHVINYDAPGAQEDYVHRAGRTGRAGASGSAITFVMDDQARDVAAIGAALGLERELEQGGLRTVQRPAPVQQQQRSAKPRAQGPAHEQRPARDQRPAREQRPGREQPADGPRSRRRRRKPRRSAA